MVPTARQMALCSGKLETKLGHFQKACAKHDGNSQKKGILSSHRSGYADQQRAHDRSAGTGGTRKNCCDHLEDTDHKSCLVSDLGKFSDLGTSSLIPVLNQDKSNTKHESAQWQ